MPPSPSHLISFPIRMSLSLSGCSIPQSSWVVVLIVVLKPLSPAGVAVYLAGEMCYDVRSGYFLRSIMQSCREDLCRGDDRCSCKSMAASPFRGIGGGF